MMNESQEQDKRPQNGKRWTLAALVALVVVVLIFQAVWRQRSPDAVEGQKLIWVQVVHGDGTVKDFDLNTTQEYLGPALVEGGVVEDNQSAYGLYILTADGETADEGEQEWWCITKGGETVNTGADQTPISDGERYELTFTVGYDTF